jgi:hypothetical protein
MRRILCCTLALAAFSAAATTLPAQEEGKARTIDDGGIFVPGWLGKIDDNAIKDGQTVKDDKLSMEKGKMHVETGPAVVYWNPKNVAKGDYTVSATFFEPKFMNRNTHPHPYGIVIAGNDMGTPTQSNVYCAVYGDGRYVVRGFGPAAFGVTTKYEKSDAIHKAAAVDQPVTQKIAMQVKGDDISCIINDVTVATYKKADVVTAGKLTSTDGVYGIRFAHNTDAYVSDLKVTKP